MLNWKVNTATETHLHPSIHQDQPLGWQSLMPATSAEQPIPTKSPKSKKKKPTLLSIKFEFWHTKNKKKLNSMKISFSLCSKKIKKQKNKKQTGIDLKSILFLKAKLVLRKESKIK